MNGYLSKTINEEAFWDWLSPKVTAKQLSEMFRYFMSLNDYFIPKYHFSNTILEEMAKTSPVRVCQIINDDQTFQKRCSNYDKVYISKLLDHMSQFISEQMPPVIAEEPASWPASSSVTQPVAEKQPNDIRKEFLTFVRNKVFWQYNDLLDSLTVMEKDIGREELFNPDPDKALQAIELLCHRHSYKADNRIDAKLLSLLKAFFTKKKEGQKEQKKSEIKPEEKPLHKPLAESQETKQPEKKIGRVENQPSTEHTPERKEYQETKPEENQKTETIDFTDLNNLSFVSRFLSAILISSRK